jgi:hypothetical protein
MASPAITTRRETSVAYGVITDIAAPVEMYDGMHHELLRRSTEPVEGLLLHVGRATSTGFQIIEVWTSKDQLDHYNRTLVWPLMAELAGGATDAPSVVEEEFQVRGLLVPAAGVRF